MTEFLVTSSVLILAVLAVRRLLAKRLSKRLQYALWGLVLLRLLLPFQLPKSPASVMNYLPAPPAAAAKVLPEPVPAAPAALPAGEQSAPEPPGAAPLSARRMWGLGWALGALVCGGWLAGANLRFGRRLRKNRRPFPAPGCRLPVYLCEEGLAAPCLYGLLRPAVYLTPAAAANEATLRWVLRHEQAHWRHGDQVWGVLRCVCLAAYWFDPLVWVAAVVSKKDCELACDETVTAGAPQEERLAYGRALVALVPGRAPAGQRFVAATIQSFNAGQMKQRVEAIARHKKPVLWALAAALTLAAAAAACTFTGAQGLVASDPGQPPGYLAQGETVKTRWRGDLNGDGYEEELVAAVSADGSAALYWARPGRGAPEVETVTRGLEQIDSLRLWEESGVLYAGLPDPGLEPDGQYPELTPARVWRFEAGRAAQQEEKGAALYEYDLQLGRKPLSEEQLAAQQAVFALTESLRLEEGALGFTIPASYAGPAGDWNIQISGRRVTDGMGMSVHYFEQENADHAWRAGESYSIPADEVRACEELTMQVSLPGAPGGNEEEGATTAVDLVGWLAQVEGGGWPVNAFQQDGQPAWRVEGDLNGDGAAEALVLTQTAPEGDLPYGQLCHIQENGSKTVLFEGNYLGDDPLHTAVMENGETLFWLEESSGTAAGTRTRLWNAGRSDAVPAEWPLPAGSGLSRQGGRDFVLYHYAYDMLEMDGGFSGASYKPYYFQWTPWEGEGVGLLERIGLPLTEQGLLRMETAPSNPSLQSLLEHVKAKGELTDILYREGGIVNINYRVAEGGAVRYHNLNLRLQDGAFGLMMGNQRPESSNPLETSDFGGTYLARISAETADAVYPSPP